MALQTLNTIKQWFKTGLKPTQAQFWDTWDSFRHKFDKIPVKEVEGLDELLLSKADKTVLDHHLADKNAHAPQVNTDWNSESGFSQLLNKPEFKTINGEPLTGDGDIIIEAGGSQDLQTTLANGNETTNGIMFNDDYYNWLKTSIDSRSIRLTDSNSDMLVAIDSAGVVTRDDSQHVSLNPQGIFFNRDTAESYLRINTSSTGVSTVNLPATEGAEITLTATDDFKTINGESIIGEGNLDIEPQGLKSVLDADPTASYGESKATVMGDYGTSKYNELIVSDEIEKTGIYQLKNQLSFDHTVLDSNDIGNITLSEGNIKLTRDKSNNQTVVDIADPVANTQLRFPAKSEEGKTYTIATTEDFKTINGESIVGSGDILINGGDGNIPTLQEVLDKDRNATNASINLLSEGGESQTTVHEGGLNISEKTETGFLITDINKLGVSVSKHEETTFANISADELSLNKNLSGNPVKQGIVLNEDSAGTSTIKLPLTSDGDVKTLTTTEDFKTINGESIVGEGDIILSEGSQDLQQTIDNGSLAVFNDSKQYVAMFNEGAPTSFGIGSSDDTYHSTLIINPDLPSIQQSSNNGDIAYVGISKNKIILSESLSAGITKIKFNPPTSISTLNFPAPSEDGEYTLPLRINGQVADKYGDVTISTDGGSQTLDQVLAAGDEAIGKSFVIKDQNISVNNNVFVSPQSIHLFSEDKDFFMTLNNFGISSLYGDQSKGLRLKKTGLNFFEYADGGVDCTLIQNTESSGLSSVVMPLMLDGETKTLATTDDFKTINGQSIIGEGDLVIGGGVPTLSQVLDAGNEVNNKEIVMTRSTYPVGQSRLSPTQLTIYNTDNLSTTMNPMSFAAANSETEERTEFLFNNIRHTYKDEHGSYTDYFFLPKKASRSDFYALAIAEDLTLQNVLGNALSNGGLATLGETTGHFSRYEMTDSDFDISTSEASGRFTSKGFMRTSGSIAVIGHEYDDGEGTTMRMEYGDFELKRSAPGQLGFVQLNIEKPLEGSISYFVLPAKAPVGSIRNYTLATTDDIKLKSYKVSTLPDGTIGDQAYVTDATAPAYLGTLTGGGSVVCPVFYNGTTWVSH